VKAMEVMIFSWEYPPRIVGQLADHVKELATHMAENGVGVYVITYDDHLTGLSGDEGGIKLFRVTNPVRTHIGVLTWVLTLNQEIERAAAKIYYDVSKHVDLVDVHDWHFIPSAVTLNRALKIPFVYSVDSLEEHRAHGANAPFNMAIKSIEWLGAYESRRLVVKSEWMRDEVTRLYKIPAEKVTVIPRGSGTWIKDTLETYASIAGGHIGR